MDVIVKANNNPVNDMTAPVSWLINDLDKAIKTKSTQSLVLKYVTFIIIYNLSYYTTHNIVPNHGTIAKCWRRSPWE